LGSETKRESAGTFSNAILLVIFGVLTTALVAVSVANSRTCVRELAGAAASNGLTLKFDERCKIQAAKKVGVRERKGGLLRRVVAMISATLYFAKNPNIVQQLVDNRGQRLGKGGE
jgi:hypothetical protein